VDTLSDKVVMVTGAGKGIGRATVQLLASRRAKIVAIARTPADLQQIEAHCKQSDVTCLTHTGDVTDEAFVTSAFAATRAAFGRVDVLVNNAGVAPFSPISDMSVMEYRRCLETNLTGVFLCMQHAVRLMKATTNTGKIINVGSVRSHWTESGDAGVYNASKAGLKSMTETVARELHGTGCQIAVGMVCPGVVNTTLTNPNHEPRPDWLDPTHVAEAILFAASAPAGVNISDITLFSMSQRPW